MSFCSRSETCIKRDLHTQTHAHAQMLLYAAHAHVPPVKCQCSECLRQQVQALWKQLVVTVWAGVGRACTGA